MTPHELRARRQALGLSQLALARRLGVSNDTVSRWERAVLGIQAPETLRLALRALEMEQRLAGQEGIGRVNIEAWNDTIAQMHLTNQRSSRLMDAHRAIEMARVIAQELGLDRLARQLDAPSQDSFHLAALAQARAAELYGELEAARDAGEEPPDCVNTVTMPATGEAR